MRSSCHGNRTFSLKFCCTVFFCGHLTEICIILSNISLLCGKLRNSWPSILTAWRVLRWPPEKVFYKLFTNQSVRIWLPVTPPWKVRTVVSLLLLSGAISLRLYTEDTTQYAAYESHDVVPEYTLNQAIMITAFKWMPPRRGKSEHICNISVETDQSRKLLGIALDTNLTYKTHVDITLKKEAYTKIAQVLSTLH